MGQENSQIQKQQVFQQINQKKFKTLKDIGSRPERQGILRFSTTPFSECQKIQIDNQILFIQKYRMNLKELLTNRIRLKKTFQAQQVMKIIKDISYALAYLEASHEPYPLLTLENIYFCKGSFKLMPPELISGQILQIVRQGLKQKRIIMPVSPQIILAVRCKENKLQEEQILFKSNIFSMGMLMLELCTLKDSCDCYDTTYFSLINQVINERISQIESLYNDKIALLIANMLDYDLQERIGPKQLSILVNRILEEQKSEKIHTNRAQINEIQSRLIIQKQTIVKPLQLVSSESSLKETSRMNKSDLKSKISEKIKRQKYLNKIPKQQEIKSISKSKSRNKIGLGIRQKKQVILNPYIDKNIKSSLKNKSITSSQNLYQKTPKYGYSKEKNSEIRSPLKSRDINLKYKYNLDIQQAPKSNRRYDNRKQLYEDIKHRYQVHDKNQIEYRRQVNQFELSPRQNYRNFENDYELYLMKLQQKGSNNIMNNKKCLKKQLPQKENLDLDSYRGNKYGNHENDSLKMIQNEIMRSKKILEEVRMQQQTEEQNN